MADIFLSYSEKDRDSARRVAETLASVGWTVWWDRRIPAGQTWRDVLDQALAQMRCMIVLWTAKSIKSEWVCEEASEGRQQGKLIPVMLEAVRPPAGFREVQAADLTGWDGSREFEGMRSLIADLESRLGPPPIAIPQPDPVAPPPRPPDPGPRKRRWEWIAAAMLLGAAMAYLAASYRKTDMVSPPEPVVARPNQDQKIQPLPTTPVQEPKIPVQEPKVAPESAEKSSPSRTATKSVASAPRPTRRPAPTRRPVTAARSNSACSEFLAQIQAGQRLSEKAQVIFDKECK